MVVGYAGMGNIIPWKIWEWKEREEDDRINGKKNEGFYRDRGIRDATGFYTELDKRAGKDI